MVAVSAAISPYREIRDEVRTQHVRSFEVYVKCRLDILVQRDVKGLYRKALKGEIGNFTGVSDPYEEPFSPETVIESHRESTDQSLERLLRNLEHAGLIFGKGAAR